MLISPEKIKQFQILYSQQFGFDISEDDANKEGFALVSMIQTILNEYENNPKRRTTK